jgi:hypothetical protein
MKIEKTTTTSTARPRRALTIRAMAIGAAASALALAAPAGATTYNSVANGAPGSTKCNLSDALKAANTNTAVNRCAAGSTGTDTINLQPGVIYQGWGTPLHVLPTGGAVVIQGAANASGALSIIRAPNYGYPAPAGGTSACSYPAAIYSGGTLTLNTLNLQASEPFTTGLCQYAGSATVSGVEIGDGLFANGFLAGGIRSIPNGNNNARTLTIKSSSRIINNISPDSGAALALFGNVTTNISDTVIGFNSADGNGGGIFWVGGWDKMGNLTLTHVQFNNNEAGFEGGWGGAMYLDPDDVNATATISGGNLQQNAVVRPEFTPLYTAGAIYVGAGFGSNKLILTGQTFIRDNLVFSWPSDPPADTQQWTFNSDPWVYEAIACRQSSDVDRVVGSEWNGHIPQLKGDNTCTLH